MARIGRIALTSFTLTATALLFTSSTGGPNGQHADTRAATVITDDIEWPVPDPIGLPDIEWP